MFFDETTSVRSFTAKLEALNQLNQAQYNKVIQNLIKEHRPAINQFFKSLDSSLSRKAQSVTIFNLYGKRRDCRNIQSAIKAVQQAPQESKGAKFVRFEIAVEFNNGDKIEGRFSSKKEALSFLRLFSE